ncbi:MAG: rhomboid family intramembrane serine protease [Alphaproteobacteria bacterium]
MVNDPAPDQATAPSQPIFNRQPWVILLLGDLIVLAHAVRAFGQYDLQVGLAEKLAVVPAAYEGPFDTWNWAALFGHVFLHADWIHLAFNMALFFAISGRVVERLGAAGGGGWRFLVLFFFSALMSALTYILINPGSSTGAIGASGAVCGVFSALLMGARWDWKVSIRDPQILRTGAGFLFANVGLAFVIRQFGVLRLPGKPISAALSAEC